MELRELLACAPTAPWLIPLLPVPQVLDCVHVHSETKDVVESTASLLKAIHRRNPPQPLPNKAGTVNGLLTVFRCKLKDEETATSCVEVLAKVGESQALSDPKSRRGLLLGGPTPGAKGVATIADFRTADGKTWEHEALALALRVLDQLSEHTPAGGGEEDRAVATTSSSKSDDTASRWSKGASKLIGSVLRLIELLHGGPRVAGEAALLDEAKRVLQALLGVLTLKHTDLIRRTDKILAALGFDTRAGGKKAVSVDDSDAGAGAGDGGVMLPKLPGAHARSASVVVRAGGSGGSGGSGGDAVASTGARNADGSSSSSSSGGMQLRRGLTAMRFFIVDDGVSPRKLYPLHPQKAFASNGQAPPRLLESWPNYLEKLNVNQSISRAFVTSPSSADRMHLTYESASAAGRGVQSRAYTPVPYLVPPEGCGEPFGHSLTFDSEFESGNLLRAVQRGDASYDLFLRADLHTEGHTQWFYFAVSNTHPAALVKLSEQGVQVPPVRVRFNIVNFTKPDSLFNLGMRPVVYSCVDASNKGIGWVRSGSDISYYSNAFTRSNSAGEGNGQYYTLSFTIEFQHPKDTVLIAYSYPYSLTDYKSHIGDVLGRPGAADVIRSRCGWPAWKCHLYPCRPSHPGPPTPVPSAHPLQPPLHDPRRRILRPPRHHQLQGQGQGAHRAHHSGIDGGRNLRPQPGGGRRGQASHGSRQRERRQGGPGRQKSALEAVPGHIVPGAPGRDACVVDDEGACLAA